MTLSTPDIPAETLDRESLFERLAGVQTLVTANSRLARMLTAAYSQWRIARGDSQWRSPDVLSWEAWLDRLWETAGIEGAAGAAKAVPGRQQMLSIWRQVLRDDPEAGRLLRPESLVARLRETRALAVDWRLDFDHPVWRNSENENHVAFQRWNRAFGALCRQHGWIAPEDRQAILAECALEGQIGLDAKTGLLGFDEFTPAQSAVVEAFLAAGHSLVRLTLEPARAKAVLFRSASARDELEQMARWVRHWTEADPDCSIAVVVPDLQSRRQEIERCLAAFLTPGEGVSRDRAKPWNVSLGRPLARYPMIESAFGLFRLLEDRIDIQDVGRVLRSPWIRGGIEERNRRALLEKRLREKYPRQLKPGEVWYRAGEIRKFDRQGKELPPDQQEPRAWNSPILVSLLDALARFERNHRAPREPSAWAEAFDRLLAEIGWPMALDSLASKEEHGDNWQTWKAWQEELRTLASLDSTTGRISRNAAISRLRQICQERIFQPRTAPADIQVLGLYEASGLRFDHLWIMGLHNGNWPQAAQPDPFIPGRLQQAVQMPQSSPQRELEVARAVTRRLLETAADCVFSYPGQADGEVVLPSPLLTVASIEPVEEVAGWSGKGWQESMFEGERPRLDPLEMPRPLQRDTARGGSSILKHQALCPFRAFAANRLGAESLEIPVDGISPMLHGSLVHRVLENFWRETRSQAELLRLDADKLEERIRSHARQVVDGERSLLNRPQFGYVEAERLARLAAAFLEHEKERNPFEVAAFEEEIRQDIEGQEIRLVIDRIDRLPSGDMAIIDYKTGKVEPGKWFGERPEDPQLPLYAISAPDTPAALAFAVVRDDECLYRGVATLEGVFPGLPPRRNAHNAAVIEAGLDMPATVENWRETLHRLMAEFLAGDARIDPKNGLKTCENSYCEMLPLCRIRELEEAAS